MITQDNLLTTIVGDKNVIGNNDICESYSRDNGFSLGENPSRVVKPRTAEQIREIVKLANREGFPLVPVSSRGPRFRGDTVPERKGAVIVDMSDMKSIVRIDRRSKTALVEPGVTFDELIDAAGASGLRVSAPLLPRQTKSVVGSLLEREPTTLPKYHWDMQDPLCCIEVIFGSGDLFRTGSAAGPGSLEAQWASGQAQKSPMGPSQTDWAKIIQGAQGTMGIVTWASIKLELMPRVEKAFVMSASNLNDLVDITYALTGKRYADHCFILNNVNFSSIVNHASEGEIPRWILFYTISGYERFPEERISYIEKDIADLALKMNVKPSANTGPVNADEVLKLIRRSSADPYWKLRKTGSFEDIIFLGTLDKSPEFINEINREMKTHGIDGEKLGVYLQPVQQGRVCHFEFSVMYDASDKNESERVQAFCTGVTKKIMEMGGFFSRPYGKTAHMVYDRCADTVAALLKVKSILDPKGVMNPGKLCFNNNQKTK
ncbi:MAG: hypothetical protein CVV44_05240 [Spirochaetae bacterium HGW-Spirochaetae-1]|jgi:FAD/FMN-containing dehydrogenase|nr:MAG: hypothetical protein CVV44_05240 [Spirochaetae bacterium HGW-Spirochaetae-1]